MGSIRDPIGTSCSLKQVLSYQQLTGFCLHNVQTVLFTEKYPVSLKISQKVSEDEIR